MSLTAFGVIPCSRARSLLSVWCLPAYGPRAWKMAMASSAEILLPSVRLPRVGEEKMQACCNQLGWLPPPLFPGWSSGSKNERASSMSSHVEMGRRPQTSEVKVLGKGRMLLLHH
jgi:hypothetical protein